MAIMKYEIIVLQRILLHFSWRTGSVFVSLAHDRHVNIEIKLENLKPQSLVTSVALCVHF